MTWLGFSARPSSSLATANSDLAFQGNHAYEGTFQGFRILDIQRTEPEEVLAFEDCRGEGGQGDVVVYENILTRSWDAPARAGRTCDGQPVPTGWEGIHVVEIPLGSPQDARALQFEQGGANVRCHDTGVILGKVQRAAYAGGNGVSVWSMDAADGGSLDDPVPLYSRDIRNSGVPDFTVGRSAAFSNDGSTMIIGHEPGGGTAARCQVTGAKRDVLVHGSYQSGIGVLDFTDLSDIREVGYADPVPMSQTGLVIGGDWSSHWYNGLIYESDINRGFLTRQYTGSEFQAARQLHRLNPQTQEYPEG